MIDYTEICREVLEAPESTPRGMRVKEIIGVQIQAEPDDCFFVHPSIPDNFEYLMKEFEWYLKGDINDLSIVEHAKLWEGHVTHGRLNSNYGYWLGPKGGDSLSNAIELLRQDRSTRRAVALIGNADCFGPSERDVPCTQSFQFMIRGKELITIVTMRSQDAWFGFRNDLPFFQLIAYIVGYLLNVNDYRLMVNVASFHAYERHWPKLREIVSHEKEVRTKPIKFDDWLHKFITQWELV